MTSPSVGMMTIAIEKSGGKTIMIVTDIGEAESLDSRPRGWNRTLANLGRLLAS